MDVLSGSGLEVSVERYQQVEHSCKADQAKWENGQAIYFVQRGK